MSERRQVPLDEALLGRRGFVLSLGGGFFTLAAGVSCARVDSAEGAAAGADTTAGAITAGEAAGSARAAAGEPGLQLYTVRQAMEQDFEGTLARVAEIGYREVEFAGYFGRSPADVRRIVEAAGLRAPSAHIPLESFERDADATLDAASEAGHTLVVIQWTPENRRTADAYRALAASFDDWGARARQRGLTFAYHNHEFEFAPLGDTNGFAILLDETDPQNVSMELDLFWITKAGHAPLDAFARWPGRFPAVHVKDMAEGERMVAVGDGAIDFAGIFARAEQAGIRHFFVEHDNPADPMESIRRSQAALARLLG